MEGKKIFVKNDVALELFKIYFGKFLEKKKLFINTKGLHDAVRIMDSQILKNAYIQSVHDFFDYFVSKYRSSLNGNDISYIREKEDYFLSNTTSNLFRLMSELDGATENVIQKAPNSQLEDFISSFIGGFLSGFLYRDNHPVVNTITEGVKGWISGAGVSREQKFIINKWDTILKQVMDEIDRMWKKLADELLDELAEHIPIIFDIDINALTKSQTEYLRSFST